MIENITLPPDLEAAIGSEKKDFAVKAGRAEPRNKSFLVILSGVAFTSFTSIFYANSEIFPPAIITVIPGISVLSWGIYSLFKKGGYFVGTPLRFIHYQNGKIRSIDWDQFSGEIEFDGNAHKGNISLKMRTGKMENRKNGPDGYVPDVISIIEIPNVFEVEKICRKRIKENDPTPPKEGHNFA
jgi:hypothetical protein